MPDPIVQAGLFRVPKAPVGQWIVTRQQSPKLASATEPKVKWAPSTVIRMHCDPDISRCLSPLVGTAGSYLNPMLVPLQPPAPQSGRGKGREGTVEDWHFCVVRGDEFPRWRTRPSFFSFKSLWVSGRLPTPHQTLSMRGLSWPAGLEQPNKLPCGKPLQQDRKVDK